jgi:hypothetical protein
MVIDSEINRIEKKLIALEQKLHGIVASDLFTGNAFIILED